MSPVTWARVEAGLPVRALTFAGVDRALGWANGSCGAFVSSGTPIAADPHARSSTDQAAAAPASRPARQTAHVSRKQQADLADVPTEDLLAEIARRTRANHPPP